MINEQDIKQIILNIVQDLDLTIDDIKAETPLAGNDGLLFDSIDILELVTEIDNKYGIKITDSSLMRKAFATFGDFYAFLKENEQ